MVFDGGTLSADFSTCAHRAETGYSSCRTRVPGAALPPGAFVGIATAGTEPPPRTPQRGPRGTTATTPPAERAALIALYNATDGPNWTHNTGWNTTEPVSTWHGVTTNSDGSVTIVYLSTNGLSGSIPTEFFDLTNLEFLYLDFNGLSGSIPAELGDLTNLQWLELGGNPLSGSIPAELGDLTDLQGLGLYSNGLSGSIPTELGDLTNLRRLWLSANSLSGSIPVDLGDLTNLDQLWLSANSLSGSIPAELGDLTNLAHLFLDGNGLSGSIPAELGDLTNLTHLRLSSNGLSGSIPAELGDLTNLTHLYLYSNSLSGSIPAELGDLTNLTQLWLSFNSLSGSIPAELGDLTNLTQLWLRSNSLSGCVPAALEAVSFISFDVDLSYCGTLELLVAVVLVGGAAVELVYSADLDGSSVPAVAAFSVTVDGSLQAISGVSVTGRAVTLTLASPLASTQNATVTYTPPTNPDDPRIQSADGDAAAGFTDQAVTIPPDPPAVTSVESTAGGLTVQWDAVADVTGYDLQWRHDTDSAWQSTRIDQQQHTIGGLADGALYWVRIRAVKTPRGPHRPNPLHHRLVTGPTRRRRRLDTPKPDSDPRRPQPAGDLGSRRGRRRLHRRIPALRWELG